MNVVEQGLGSGLRDRQLTWQDFSVKDNPSLSVRIGDQVHTGGLTNTNIRQLGPYGVHIGDFPDGIYYPYPRIGDPVDWPPTVPPLEVGPHVPWVLDRQTSWITPNICVTPSVWISTFTNEGMTLRTDVPGVKFDDLNVEIDLGIIKVTAKRNDSGEQICRTYILDAKYDPQSCEATLENGVLTIAVKKLLEHRSKPIKVVVK